VTADVCVRPSVAGAGYIYDVDIWITYLPYVLYIYIYMSIVAPRVVRKSLHYIHTLYWGGFSFLFFFLAGKNVRFA